MITKVLLAVLILLAFGALYLLFHFAGKPEKKKPVECKPTETVPLNTAIKDTTEAMRKLGMSISEGLNPATVHCIPKPQGSGRPSKIHSRLARKR